MKYFIAGAVLFVTAAVIAGFFVVGSPTHERAARFDAARQSDLQEIQYELINYLTAKGWLPAVLSDMTGFENFTVPKDPESGMAYEYAVKSFTPTAAEFQLCAYFDLASTDENDTAFPVVAPAPYAAQESANWKHPAGHGCFDLSVGKIVSGNLVPPPVTV